MRIQVKQNGIRLVLRILLPIVCLLWVGFIFSNSLRTGEQSSAQSSAVVETVQEVAKVVAPGSTVANATGEDYDKLHEFIRVCAHFAQFAILGALLGWCYFSYTNRWTFFYLPTISVVLISIADEGIQGSVAGRAGEMVDLLIDVFGGLSGIVFSILSVLLIVLVYKRRKKTVG